MGAKSKRSKSMEDTDEWSEWSSSMEDKDEWSSSWLRSQKLTVEAE
jgi:hypothetical protein